MVRKIAGFWRSFLDGRYWVALSASPEGEAITGFAAGGALRAVLSRPLCSTLA
jgi:hypothetical protein